MAWLRSFEAGRGGACASLMEAMPVMRGVTQTFNGDFFGDSLMAGLRCCWGSYRLRVAVL